MKKLSYSLAFLFVSCISYAQALTNTENYVYSRTYLEAVSVETPTAKQIQEVQYFDGLGRPMQNIAIKASATGKDIVISNVYNKQGISTKSYLPVSVNSLDGAYQTAVDSTSANTYYGISNAYSEVLLEKSPLGRVLKKAHPGADWAMSTANILKFDYKSNISNEVKRIKATTVWNTTSKINEVTIALAPNDNYTTNNYYNANTLHKKIVKDEDNKETHVFTNGKEQTILSRKINADSTKNADTYYVYDEFDNLVLVIPPKAADFNTITDLNNNLNSLCYQYRYDQYNRLAEKRMPGRALWEYVVYDKQGRPILTQNANQNAKKWSFVKYDQLGRIIYSGIYTHSTAAITRAALQTLVDGNTTNPLNNENRSTTAITLSGQSMYYTNTAFPNNTTSMEVLSIHYYDAYPNSTPFPAQNKIQGITIITEAPNVKKVSTKSLPTASFVKNISDNGWTKTYNWYDTKGRSIGAHSYNHLGGFTKTESVIDFAGIPEKVETYHRRLATDAVVTVKERFVYNPQGFFTQHFHQVDSNPEEKLAEYTYDELGQVTNKKTGNNLQSIDYTYNIRGWLTKVNNPANLNGKLFAYELKYNNPTNASLATANYNGNISEVDWSSSIDDTLRRYGYLYDDENRLTKANYQEPHHTTPELHFYDEEIAYDKNGNIATMKRNAKPGKGLTPSLVDNLTYFYNGNQLHHIAEASANVTGYPGGGSTNTYDDNGNMLTMPDKKITQNITYNFLDLPENIVQNNLPAKYSYRADGVKLKKVLTIKGQEIKTEYLDGFVYTSAYSGSLKAAVEGDNDIAKDAASADEREAFALEQKAVPSDPSNAATKPYFFPTSEGFYDFENKKYIYQYKDHLGNVRLSYAKNPTDGSAEYLNRNNYYPFGLNFIGANDMSAVYNPSTTYANTKYNGKELQETGAYDYGWRQYMPDIGRWNVMDQLSETYHSYSPYAYVMNNPIMMYDPDGREAAFSVWQDMWDTTPNGTNSYWYSNGGGGFTSYDGGGGASNYGGNGLAYGSTVGYGGGFTMGDGTYTLPPLVLNGNSSGWGSQIQNHFNSYMGEWNFQQHSQELAYDMRWAKASSGGVVMMDSMWDVLGIAAANMKSENKHAAMLFGAVGAIIARNPSIAKAGFGAEKAIVLGEGMGRIKIATKVLQTEGVNAKWYQAWSKNFPNRELTSVELSAAKARNAAWLNSKIDQGYKVYDIGQDINRPTRSIFYELEQSILQQRNYPTTILNGY